MLRRPARSAPLAELPGAVDEVVDTAPLGAARRPRAPTSRSTSTAAGRRARACCAPPRPRRLIAFGDGRRPRWRAPDEHEVVRWCRLLEESGIPADPDALDLPAPAGARPPRPGATVLHPGAASAARRWPAERFAAVARAEREAGRRVVVTGSAAERDARSRVARAGRLPR